jgi:hypothetical protein
MCVGAAVAIVLALVNKTPLGISILLLILGALLIYPVLHFIKGRAGRILAFIALSIGTTLFGYGIWPDSSIGSPMHVTSMEVDFAIQYPDELGANIRIQNDTNLDLQARGRYLTSIDPKPESGELMDRRAAEIRSSVGEPDDTSTKILIPAHEGVWFSNSSVDLSSDQKAAYRRGDAVFYFAGQITITSPAGQAPLKYCGYKLGNDPSIFKCPLLP